MITSCILFLLAYDNHLKKDVACLCLLNMQRPFFDNFAFCVAAIYSSIAKIFPIPIALSFSSDILRTRVYRIWYTVYSG